MVYSKLFYRKGVIKNLAKLTGKPTTLLKKALVQVFFCELFEIFKNRFFTEQL